ncbi:hypothetical protein [Streptomyces sp. 8N706]
MWRLHGEGSQGGEAGTPRAAARDLHELFERRAAAYNRSVGGAR